MAKKTAAQRAAKKHAKSVKRKKRLAARPAPVPPEARWKPAIEGIAGLARRMDVDRHVAATLADQMYKAGERPDAAEAWLPSRVDALTTEDLLARLEALGIHTDAETFDPLTEAHASAARLFEVEWAPHLSIDASVHDADLAAEAVEVLWGRWKPDLLPAEWLLDGIYDAGEAFDDGQPDETLATLLDLWGLCGDAPLPWLQRCAAVEEFGPLLYDALAAATPGPELDEGLAVLEAVAPHVHENGDFPAAAVQLAAELRAR